MEASNQPAQSDATTRYGYDAFISYSHAADNQLAPALQTGLQQLARPWYKIRALRIFRDKTGLAATPALWATIVGALSDSGHFLLLASPTAAQSLWVRDEVEWWLKSREIANLFIVLTDGELVWDPAAGDFDWRQTSALPETLSRCFSAEPLYVDLRWARTETDLSLRNLRFRGAVLDLAAPLHGIAKYDLDGEDVRQHNRVVWITRVVVTTLATLLILVSMASYLAWRQSRIAVAGEQSARARVELQRDPQQSLSLALNALAACHTEEAKGAVRDALIEAHVLRVIHHAAAATAGAQGVTAAAFSPDGRFIITAGEDGWSRVWDVHAGDDQSRPRTELMHVRELSNDLRQHLTGASFSPSGTLIVTTGWDGAARLWDASSGAALLDAPLPPESGDVASAQFSRDGRYLVTASGDGGARVWDVEDGSVSLRLSLPPTDGALRYAAFSPDGRRLATVGSGNEAVVWDLEGQMPVARLRHARPATHAQFSADGGRLATASADGTAYLWEARGAGAATWTNAAILHGHGGAVNSVAFGPDDRLLLTASDDGTARLWDTTLAQAVAVLRGHGAAVTTAAFGVARRREGTTDELEAVTASTDGTARVWDLSRAQSVRPLHPKYGPVSSVTFSVDGRIVVTAGDTRPRVWGLPHGVLVSELADGGPAVSVAFSPDGTRMLTVAADERARIWDATTWTQLAEVALPEPLDFDTTDRPFAGGAFCEHGAFFVVASGRVAQSWVIDGGAVHQLGAPMGHDALISHVGCRPTDAHLVTAAGSAIYVWNARAGATTLSPIAHTAPVSAMALSADGDTVVSATADGVVQRWSTQSGAPVGAPLSHAAGVTSLALSPRNDRLVVVTGEAFRLWDASAGAAISAPIAAKKSTRAAFHPSGDLFVTTSLEEDHARVWDANSATLIATVSGDPGIGMGVARFSPDGQHLVTAASGGTAGEGRWPAHVFPSEAFDPFGSVIERARWQLAREPPRFSPTPGLLSRVTQPVKPLLDWVVGCGG